MMHENTMLDYPPVKYSYHILDQKPQGSGFKQDAKFVFHLKKVKIMKN